MVVVGPGVVHDDVCTTLLLGAGVGCGRDLGVDGGVEPAVLAARTVTAVLGAVDGRFFGVKDADGAAAEVVARDVPSGGDCDPRTSTLPDPLLHPVTASMKQSPAVAIPLLPIRA